MDEKKIGKLKEILKEYTKEDLEIIKAELLLKGDINK